MVKVAQKPNREVIQADSHDVLGLLGCPRMADMIGSAGGELKSPYDVDGERLLLWLWRCRRHLQRFLPPALQEIINRHKANERAQNKYCNHTLPHFSSPNTQGFDCHRLSKRQVDAHNPFQKPSCEQLIIYFFCVR
jgi:hypothetical protein